MSEPSDSAPALTLKSEVKSKNGNGGILVADRVAGSYTVAHENLGLAEGTVPYFLVLSEKQMAVVSLAVLLADQAGLYNIAHAMVEQQFRKNAMAKAAAEANAADKEDMDDAASAAFERLLKQAGL